MDNFKVLFVCVHNSARSQMAEAFLNIIGHGDCEAESAGLEAGVLNPYVVEVMRELKIDISKNKTKNVFDFFKQGIFYNYVITVCDESSAEKCPIFPSAAQKLHWSFEDPSAFTGTYEEILDKTRIVRDHIMAKIQVWVEELRLKHSN